MSSFIPYLDPAVSLEERLARAFAEFEVDHDQIQQLRIFINLLKKKDEATYEHSVRVALLACAIARFMHLNGKVMLYAGLLHDMGKAQTNPKTLKKTSGWNADDTTEIMKHVMDGYRLIRGAFDFSAEITLWHHRFQLNCYPKELPDPLHDYSQGMRVMIPVFGRLLALADQFDALHRKNDRLAASGKSVGEWIKECMLKDNRDQDTLVKELYEAGILTTQTFE